MAACAAEPPRANTTGEQQRNGHGENPRRNMIRTRSVGLTMPTAMVGKRKRDRYRIGYAGLDCRSVRRRA